MWIMCVHIDVAPEFLCCADVASRLKQVRREALPQRVRRGWLGKAGIAQGSLEGFLDDLA